MCSAEAAVWRRTDERGDESSRRNGGVGGGGSGGCGEFGSGGGGIGAGVVAWVIVLVVVNIRAYTHKPWGYLRLSGSWVMKVARSFVETHPT